MLASPSRLSSQINVPKLLSDLKECVQELVSDFTSSNIPIDDDNIILQRFCGKLEQFLQIGFAERSSLFGRKKGYWDFLKLCLVTSKRGGVDSGIKFANNNPEVRTSAGRGRAFIRYCLAHSCLGDALQQCLMSPEALGSWYASTAPVRDSTLAERLVALAYDVAEVNFDLAPGGHDLDAGWPSFARRQFAGLSWKPLSRSASFASLSSSFNNTFQDPSSPPPGGSMGGMESLPERQSNQDDDPWWSQRPTSVDQEMQTERDEHDETEVRALLKNQNQKLQSENDSILEKLNLQISDYNKIQEKLKFYEEEMRNNEKDSEIHELRMQLTESKSESNKLKTEISELQVQCSQLTTQLAENTKLEQNHDSSEELKAQLAQAQTKCETMELQIKTDEGKMQQAKWEMSSLQTCVDNLLKENAQLRNDLTQMSQTFSDSREKFTTNEMYVEKLSEQVTALKDVVSIGKQMLGMRDTEVEQLQRKVQNLEDMLETEREKNTVLSEAFTPDTDIKKEYQAQMANFQSLKEIYTQRTELMGLENDALKDTLGDKNKQIELMEKRFNDLKCQYENLKESFAEKEKSANELQHRVCDLNEDCRSLTNQLSLINNLFTELGKSDVDLERLRSLQDALAEGLTDNYASNLSRVWCAFSELLDNTVGETPQPVEGSEGCYKSVNTPYGPQVVISVSQTFLRLKDLILEKKSLQKELGQLRNLNTHLETKLQTQENRLSLVLQELKKTWGVVNKMRSQHSQLRTSEAILRYDLQQKRKIVTELKEEMESCRETWQQARNKTSESEKQYRNLRDEFASRRRRPLLADDSTEVNSAESGYSDGRGEDDSAGSSTSDCEENTGTSSAASKSPDILPFDDSRPGSAGADSTLSNETALELSSSPNDSLQEMSNSSPKNAENTTISTPNNVRSTSTDFNIVSATPNTTISTPIGNSTLNASNTVSTTPNSAISTPKTVSSMSSTPNTNSTVKPDPGSSNTAISTPNTVSNTQNSTAPMSPNTGAIKKVFTPSEPSTEVPSAEEPPKVEEVLDARAARLKRLEEQCSQLFKRVVRTSNMSVAISNRLEELHEQYGENQENSARRRLRNNSESETSNNNIPEPPPMPIVIPNTRLPTQINDDTTFFDVPEPPLLKRPAERFRRRPSEEMNPQKKVSISSSIHNKEVTESRDLLSAKLEEERDRGEKIDRELTSLKVELVNQEGQLKQLSEQLASQGEQLLSKQEVENNLETKQAECEAFILKVQQLSETESELRQRLELTEQQSGSRLSQLEELQGDTKHLHAAIIKLTKQKDALFKECYALKQAKRESSWQPDHQVVSCSSCAVSFSLLVRKHHCRVCGQIFCGACSSHWVTQHGENGKRSRSCSECHSKNQLEASSVTEAGDDTELAIGAEDEEDEEEDFSVISEEEVVLSQCVPYSPNPEILQYWKSCEIQSGLTRNVSELLSAGQKVTESVWVRAGLIYAVPLLIKAEDCSPQVNVTWQFTTEPKCIAFSVLHKTDADIPTENSSILVPTTRVNSHLHPIKGRLRARRQGLYTLMFDNSYSRFTGKKVNFTLMCEVGSSNSGRSSSASESPLCSVSESASSQDLLDTSSK